MSVSRDIVDGCHKNEGSSSLSKLKYILDVRDAEHFVVGALAYRGSLEHALYSLKIWCLNPLNAHAARVLCMCMGCKQIRERPCAL